MMYLAQTTGGVIAVILVLAAGWRILEKAGKPGWHILVPFLDAYDLCDICWKGGYGILLMILPIAVTVLASYVGNSLVLAFPMLIIALMHLTLAYKLSKSFGKGFFMTLLLLFIPVLGLLILGFGSSEYIGKEYHGKIINGCAA